MPELHDLLERRASGYEPSHDLFERVHDRRRRRDRNRRIRAGILGIAVLALAAVGFVRLLGSERSTPAVNPESFAGTWISTSDGSTQTMVVRVSAEDAVEIVVTDDFTGVCAGTSSTMTGTGRIEGGTALVFPAPVYTCDAGGQIENETDPPIRETLRDWTLVLDPETDTLSDNLGGLWMREGPASPSPAPAASGRMWPQTSYQEVVQAQELADAGDPRYTWQVDPDLASEDNLYPWDSEIVERFLREGLGWEEWRVGKSGTFSGQPGVLYDEVELIRCAPGRTNPLYPVMPADVTGCAPTIDDFRYETVRLDLHQPGFRGPSGIWVVTDWETLQPVEPGTFNEHLYPYYELRQVVQVAPPSDAEVTELLQSFLQARVDGEGAEQYVHRHLDGWDDREIPVMYATTEGSPYDRFEFDRRQGPVWPTGWIEYRIHLFAEDGTEVEQTFIVVRQEDGRLGLMYGPSWVVGTNDLPTTEDGQAVPVPYRFLDGEVTLAAAPPWDRGGGDTAGSLFLDLDRSWMRIAADPLPVGAGCAPGAGPADAEALARSISSDPDLEATDPVPVRIGGIDALQIDVTLSRGVSCSRSDAAPTVVEKWWLNDEGGRRPTGLRVYVLDLPGGSARTLTIAILASNEDFDRVVEAAAPVLDSIEFHAR